MSGIAIAFVISAAAGAAIGAVVAVRIMRRAAESPPRRVGGRATGIAMLFSTLLQIGLLVVPAVLLFALADDPNGRLVGVFLAFPGALMLTATVAVNVLFRRRSRREA